MKSLNGLLDLATAVTLACAAAAIAYLPEGSAGVALRTVFALPLVLLLPGYALVAALLPRLERRSAEGLVYSVGLSLAVAVLGGLALDATSRGIERRPLALTLAGVTVVAAAAAPFRRRPPAAGAGLRARPRPTPRQVLVLAIALLLVAAALGIARLGAIQANRRSTFTQLWMLPTQGTGGAAGTMLRVGIRNDEGREETYRLLVRVGSRRLALWPSLALGSGRRRVQTVTLPAGLPGRQPVEAELFRASDPGRVYRHVTFWPVPHAPGP